MAHDCEIEPGVTVGQWVHDEIVRTLIIEREPWALQRVGGAEKCLNFFHIMELIALDAGDDDIVFGPDPDSDGELLPGAPLLTKARIWAWQRTRGYLPLQDRAGAIRAHLAGRAESGRRPA
jgi:hypothetical protein